MVAGQKRAGRKFLQGVDPTRWSVCAFAKEPARSLGRVVQAGGGQPGSIPGSPPSPGFGRGVENDFMVAGTVALKTGGQPTRRKPAAPNGARIAHTVIPSAYCRVTKFRVSIFKLGRACFVPSVHVTSAWSIRSPTPRPKTTG